MSDDPLELKDLAVKYDYLVYKINDHIASLAEITHQSVQSKRHLIDTEYLDQQLHLDHELAHADKLLLECSELEALFMKLDQLYMFVDDFKARVGRLEREFSHR